MLCLRCRTENREGRRFCAECGTSLALACSACGFSNEPGEKFCGGCGAPLTAPAPSVAPGRGPEQQAPPGRPSPAERRQLAVMFCDLVGSTALAQGLDPEDMRDVMRAYQAACAEVITRFDGHIAQYLGDGLLVYFGYPLAHEDDARRAIRAALGILRALQAVNSDRRQDRGGRLAVRIGIHTGLVVVGEIGAGSKHEHLALGETPNLAARLQALAKPTVVISASTHRLAKDLFACEDLGDCAVRASRRQCACTACSLRPPRRIGSTLRLRAASRRWSAGIRRSGSF
jgi:class 3 adenylate cyclase